MSRSNVLPRGAILSLAVLTGLFVVFAISGCRASSEDAPRSVDAAREAYESGQFETAANQAQAIVDAEPGNLEARKVLALALAAQGMNEQAIEQYGYVVERQPEDDSSLYQMAMLERVIGRTDEAIGHLEAAVELKADASYMDDLARTYMQVGRFEDAAALWGRVLEDEDLDDASRVEVLKLQATAYEDARRYEEARAALDKALFLAPNDEELKSRIEALD